MMIWTALREHAERWNRHLSNAQVEIPQEMDMEFKHKSVLLNETIEGLRVKPMESMWMAL